MFRILITPAIYDTRATAREAKELAMREAQQLSRDCALRVECRVYRMGLPELDDFGRDVTPAFLIGRAIGTASGVEWRDVVTPTRARIAA